MRDKLGYYLVGNRKFYNKVAAILEFQKTMKLNQKLKKLKNKKQKKKNIKLRTL